MAAPSPWARLWGASAPAAADAPPASERIEELRRDVAELREQLAPQLKADIERVTGEGRPFDPAAWVMGVPDSRKYPAGPAFMVRAIVAMQRGCADAGVLAGRPSTTCARVLARRCCVRGASRAVTCARCCVRDGG